MNVSDLPLVTDPSVHKAMVEAARTRFEKLRVRADDVVPPSGFAVEDASMYWTYISTQWRRVDLYA